MEITLKLVLELETGYLPCLLFGLFRFTDELIMALATVPKYWKIIDRNKQDISCFLMTISV